MTDLPKRYNAKEIDSKWYEFWEEGGYFSADPSSDKEAYCIVIPPPNITGVLHMGHALVNTLQDTLIRWKRMQGFETLWVPGLDHAGIATQTVVEKNLIAKYGKRRKDYSREEFLEHVWDWKEKNAQAIVNQIKRLGCSCDWSRMRFTMDEVCSKSVRAIFKKMFDQGLIYRGDYLVNWDPVTQTALADDEVEYEDKQSHLWYFKYPIKGHSEHVLIATTRPETMLGDTAVAVSPADERYKHLIGQTVILPIVGREIPIIADRYVDPEFGTGMVKITPAHDPNDYQIGINHDLPFVNIMTADGCINENGAPFEGLSMADARVAVIDMMKGLGLLEKIEAHPHRVGISYRSKAVIEPYMSKQWFVKMGDFAKKMRSAVEDGDVKLVPQNWENTYFHWADKLRDWCISRQLWWGHRIPIWYHVDDADRVICFEGEGLPPEVEANPEKWRQDEDVLDTWFSSALWPFSVLGWPDQTPDLEKFYPNSVLVTGHDILFFWVARMVLMGEYVHGKHPFAETFLHGLIYGKSYWRDDPQVGAIYVSEEERKSYDMNEKPVPSDVKSKWEKMSKSKGNIIDPLEVIDEYGTDAIRLSLCVSAPQSREIDLDRRRFEDFKNFTNKIWNGARFIFMNLTLSAEEFSKGLNEDVLALEDKWIISSMNVTIREVNQALENYAFDRAAMSAYDFFWKEFCAYYVEISKPILFAKVGTQEERENKQKLLVILLCQTMRLLHPIAPFITEELFQHLKTFFGEGLTALPDADLYTQDCVTALNQASCMLARYPSVLKEADINEETNAAFKLVEDLVYAIRNIRGEMKLAPNVAIEVFIIAPKENIQRQQIEKNSTIIEALVRIKGLNLVERVPEEGFGSTSVLGDMKIFVPLPEELKMQEISRLKKEKERLEKVLDRTEKQLANESFISRAPQELVDKQHSQLKQTQTELASLEEKLEQLL